MQGFIRARTNPIDRARWRGAGRETDPRASGEKNEMRERENCVCGVLEGCVLRHLKCIICVCFERGVLKWDLSGKVLMGEREGEGLAGLRPE